MKIYLHIITIVLFLVFSEQSFVIYAQQAQESSSIADNTPVRTATAVGTYHKLGAGDMVTYRVLEDKDPPVQLVVTDTGDLDIPYLGRVKVAGKTLDAAKTLIRENLERDLYYKATVQLGIDQFAKIKDQASIGTVYLSGQVRTPGPQSLSPDEINTAGKIILRAGGLADFADSRKVKIVRKATPGVSPQTEIIDLKEVLERGRIDKDIEVHDGDMIIVPQRLLNW